jgi:hypothetical protein
MSARSRLLVAGLIALLTPPALADTPVPPPVAAIVDGRLTVGDAQLPVFVSRDWSWPLPELHRAVIVIHGYERNAADYARNMMALGPPADTLVVAPQFLAPEDIAAHHLPDPILRWRYDLWSGGSAAEAPAPVGAYAALDALLAKLANRTIFPNLSQIVVAGFSAGGQVVQRYAIVGQGESAAARAGITARYVVGSPSSYAYLLDDRPLPGGGFGSFADGAQCPAYNRWKYGFAGDLPPYVAAAAAPGLPELERSYAQRDIVYLVGVNDNDPNSRYLDTSYAAQAQGPNRLARMQFFFAALKQRDGGLPRQHMASIGGAAHNEARVFGSPCGRAALFGDAACPGP